MIADMPSNKEFNPTVTELFIRGGKLNISLVFITKSYFAVPKKKRLCECLRKMYCKTISFLVYANLASDNTSHFRKNL